MDSPAASFATLPCLHPSLSVPLFPFPLPACPCPACPCSDIFEEQGFDSLAWDGKFGMQTIAQVPKPVYRGMQLIANQPSATVPLTVVPPAGVTPQYRATSVTAGTLDATVAVEDDGSRVVALLTNFNTVGNAIAAQAVTVSGRKGAFAVVCCALVGQLILLLAARLCLLACLLI